MKRSIPSAKLFKFVVLEETAFLMPVFHDLSDREIYEHYKRAIDDEDFEYAESAMTELTARNSTFTPK